jgi:GH25 family lysozyme M1 (1,4-beta-N-acetylmuramidase)
MTYQLGIDISRYQVRVDWNRVRAEEVKFVMIKAMEGTWPDSRFKEHWAGSKAVGLLRGVYHYYRDEQDPKTQARKLHELLQSTGDLGELPPALDIEEINNPRLSASKIKVCLEELTKVFGRKPFVYTRATVWNPKIGKVSWASQYPLWIAHYTIAGWSEGQIQRVAQGRQPDLPSPWSNWDIWQITDKCPASDYGVSGTTLDLDFATEETLKRLTGKSIPTGTGVGVGTVPSPPSGGGTPVSTDPWDAKAIPTVTPSLSIKITWSALNIRSNTNVSGSSPSGSIVGNVSKNTVHRVYEVAKVNDRIWARIGTGRWAVVEKRTGEKYAEFINVEQTTQGQPASPPPQPASGDPFDTRALPAVTSTLSVRVLTGALNLRRTTDTRNNLPSAPTNGALSKNTVKRVLEVVRIEDRIWAKVGADQWLVIEKRDGTKYAEFVNA